MIRFRDPFCKRFPKEAAFFLHKKGPRRGPFRHHKCRWRDSNLQKPFFHKMALLRDICRYVAISTYFNVSQVAPIPPNMSQLYHVFRKSFVKVSSKLQRDRRSEFLQPCNLKKEAVSRLLFFDVHPGSPAEISGISAFVPHGPHLLRALPGEITFVRSLRNHDQLIADRLPLPVIARL